MIESPTYHIGMIKGRLPRHPIATPPPTFKLGLWRRTPFSAVLAALRECTPFPILPVTFWGRTPFPVALARFLDQLLRFQFGDWIHVLDSLAETAEVGTRPAATLQKCSGAASELRTSPSAILPNCAKR